MIRTVSIGVLAIVAYAQNNNPAIADMLARGVTNTYQAAKTDDVQFFAEKIDMTNGAIARIAADIASIELVFDGFKQTPENEPEPVSVKDAAGLAHIIHMGESRRRGANDYNRGSTSCRGSNRENIRLTEMTFGEIAYFQSLPTCHKQKLLAVGTYQDIDVTRAMRALGIKSNVKYSAAMQDKVFAFYLTQSKQPAIAKYIRTGKNLRGAGHSVAAEWASIKSPISNKGLYDGKGTNKAHISALLIAESLQRARITYTSMVNAGYSDSEAYAKAVGV